MKIADKVAKLQKAGFVLGKDGLWTKSAGRRSSGWTWNVTITDEEQDVAILKDQHGRNQDSTILDYTRFS